MFSSAKYSYLFLRLGLAAVFLWFGADKLFHPNYWITALFPLKLAGLAAKLGISQIQAIYGAGVFEIFIGLSLAASVLTKFFSLLAILYLFVILLSSGFSEIAIRDIGLIGGLAAVFLWPNFRNRL